MSGRLHDHSILRAQTFRPGLRTFVRIHVRRGASVFKIALLVVRRRHRIRTDAPGHSRHTEFVNRRCLMKARQPLFVVRTVDV